MLQLQGIHSVYDPVEAQNWVYDHGRIVPPGPLVSQRLPKERMLCIWVAKAPIVVYIPEATVDGIDCSKGDEEGTIGGTLIYTIDAEYHVEHDSRCVFSQVQKVRECIAGVMIASVTLDRAPNAGKGGEKAQ